MSAAPTRFAEVPRSRRSRCVTGDVAGFEVQHFRSGHWLLFVWQRGERRAPLIAAEDPTDTRRKHWTGRYAVVLPSQPAAFDAMASIVARLQARECLPCGSPLLNEEIHETRGIACYSCDGLRQANGGRWPT